MTAWQQYLDENQVRFITELLDFIRIPSISALPKYSTDVERAAQWMAERLENAGIENTAVMPTGGHPIVYGDWLHADGQPTILIYGHFDVQPIEPIDAWSNPPFEPIVKDDCIYARGASDNKGSMMTPILACEALLYTEGRLPVNIKFLFEGQEEIGSPLLPPFVAEHRNLLACDVILNVGGKATTYLNHSPYAHRNPYSQPANIAAAEVLTVLYEQTPYSPPKGTMPLYPLFLKELGVYTIDFGFSIDDENWHEPNEFFRLRNYERGQQGYCMLLHRLAQ